PAGDRQTLDSSGPQALSGDPRWSDDASPWTLSPIDLFRIFDPEVAAAGYGDDGVVACMRVRGGRAKPSGPELYSVPGNGRGGVPSSELNRASPYSPQQLVGIPADQATGPNLLLFTRGLRGSGPLGASAYSLNGPAGAVDARLVTEGTQGDAGSGAWFRGGGVLIPTAPLAPFADYVARVTWHRDADATLPAADVEQVVSFETAGLPNAIDVVVTTSGAVSVIRVQTTAPNPSLRLSGPRQLTDIPRLSAGVARYADLEPGTWTACAKSGGRAVGYAPASVCKPFVASAKVPLTLPFDRGRTTAALTVPAVADGRRAQVTISRYKRPCPRRADGRRHCTRITVGHATTRTVTLAAPVTRLALPARRDGLKVSARVVLPAFAIGDAPYLATDVRRTWE
ncbi:MAG: hypothetical protein QOJ35_828, partial [Solirubrobacteraceae bacterium]|nr:hypothetical protein [Solirubrobacteraceae bacterium]